MHGLLLRCVVLESLLAVVACGARYGARTAVPGTTDAHVSLSGPVAKNLGPPLPLPLTRVGAAHGVRDGLELSGGVHTTAALFGVAGVDMGMKYQLVRDARWAVAVSGVVNALVGFREAVRGRVYPELGLHVERRLAARWHLLGGALGLAQLDAPRGKPSVLAAPYAGIEYGRAGGARWAVSMAWVSPWQDSTSVVDYAPGTAGALLIQLGHRRRMLGGGP